MKERDMPTYEKQVPKTIWERLGFMWKIQFDIVTIFIFLISLFSLITTSFSYFRNYEGILNLSEVLTKQATKNVVMRVANVIQQAELLAGITQATVKTSNEVSIDNHALVNYLLNALEKQPSIHTITIVTEDGNVLSVGTLYGNNHYFLNSEQELPVGARYVIHVVDRISPQPHELWEYKDTTWTTLGSEFLPLASYNPRLQDWYKGVTQWPNLRWDSLPNKNVSVSVPVVNANKKVFAAINIQVSLQELGSLLALEKIGKKGRAIVFNSDGEILTPTAQHVSKEDGFSSLAAAAYKDFVHMKKQAFLFHYKHVAYLVNFNELPLDFDTKWLVAVIIPFQDFFGAILQTQQQIILISFGILLIFAVFVYLASKHISTPIVKLAKSVDRIQNFDFQEPVQITSHIKEISILASSLDAMRNALASFGRYVPKEIVKTLIGQKQEIGIGSERREITVLFSDIENFTTFAEAFPIDELNVALSEYFEALSKEIVETEGTIDKYIGDSIMAFWNAPSVVVDQGYKACLAVLRCIKLLNHPDEKNVLLKGHTRFGLHSGEAIVGNIGTLERMNYTAIGNVVNTASRLESLNKIYKTSIIISETIHEKIGTRFITRPLDFIVVKGRTRGITIFELMGTQNGEEGLNATPEQIELSLRFTEAYEAFHAGKIDKAMKEFLAIREKFPEDAVTQLYIERLQSKPLS